LKPADRAFELVNGFRASQIVRAAVELGIPDLVADGPRSSEELTAATHIHADRLRRLLRGLVALGVLEQSGDDRFSNTEVGELFREGARGSRRAMTRMLIPETYRAWDYFLETVRTGVPGQLLAHGGTLWESIARDPDYAVRFNEAMAANSQQVVDLVASLDFASARLIVDVAGGKGSLAGGIVKAHPHLTAIICDIPAGLAEAPEYLAAIGVADRCEVVQSDFFESVPSGGDVYLLKDILHDWDDEHAAAILSVCRRAMRRGARIMIVERLAASRVTNDPVHLNAVMADLQMMVLLGGRERSVLELKRMFERANFVLESTHVGDPFQVVVGLAQGVDPR
jgi:hypothetical protein